VTVLAPTGPERKLLLCLLAFYREVGPGATPAVKGLDEEAGIEPYELSDAVRELRRRGLIEYWELQPAVRLTPEGLRLAMRLEEEGGSGT
jgi:Mn-dependent DtxR family transcriptional regulator